MEWIILPTYKRFTDSPDTGWPDCICSRCSQVIPENDMPLRMWPTPDELTAEERAAASGGYEYRFCEACQKAAFGIDYGDRMDSDSDGY